MIKFNFVYIGTFDPVHNGHINVVNNVLNLYTNSRILIVASSNPVNKDNVKTSIYHRNNMLKLCFDNDNIDILNIEYDYKIHYTFDTLNRLSCEYNNIGLIIGSDTFLLFFKFKNYIDILKKYKIIVFLRDEKHKNQVMYLLDFYKKAFNSDIDFLDNYIFNFSSSKFREHSILLNVNKFLPIHILEYIKNNNLYGYKND